MTLYQPAGEGPPSPDMAPMVSAAATSGGAVMPLGSSTPPRVRQIVRQPAMGDEAGSLLPSSWQYEDTHMLGLATVTAAAGTFLGARIGGPYGAVAGVLTSGALINTLRAIKLAMHADPSSDKEALISGTYAVICAVGGGWLCYYGHKRKRR